MQQCSWPGGSFDGRSCFGEAVDVALARYYAFWSESIISRFCLLLTDDALQYDPAQAFVKNTYLGAVPVLRENTDALASLVDPGFVAGYLAENASSAALFGSEDETWVGLAFDWAAAALKARSTREAAG